MLIRFRPPGFTSWFPVTVELGGDPNGAELVDAMVASQLVAHDERSAVTLDRTGALVDTETTLSALGLRSGDLIAVAPTGTDPGRSTTRSDWEVLVASGPGAGARLGVGVDGCSVGRDPAADLSTADAGLSAVHFAVDLGPSGPQVRDLGSRNGTFHAGVRVGEDPVPVHPDLPIEAGASLFRVVHLGTRRDAPRVQVSGGIAQVGRTPRPVVRTDGTRIDVPTPPEPRQSRRIPWIASATPLLMAPMMVVAGGSPAFLLMILLTPLMMLGSWYEDRRHGGKDHREEVDRYNADLDETAEQLREAVLSTSAALWKLAPDPATLVERTAPDAAIWERRADDPDFGLLRLGWNERTTPIELSHPSTGDRTLRRRAEERLEAIRGTSNLPVTVNLHEIGCLGLVEDGAGPTTASWLVLQLAVLHSPRDLQLAALVPDRTAWEWLTRLPHAFSDGEFSAVAEWTDAAALLGGVSREIAERRERRSQRVGGARFPALVVLVSDQVDLPRNLVTELLEEGPAVDVHTIWSTDTLGAVPAQCRATARISAHHLAVSWADTGDRIDDAAADILSLADVEEAAWRLSGLRDAATRDLASEVPRTVSLAENLGLDDPDAQDILTRWRRARGLSAPLGRDRSSQFWIDLREDGPHALLGGTTGAGKSELLQTLVASFAATHSPDDLTFLLVDYKGGAAFKDCVDLPHTVGYVTDLDGHLVLRVLTSLHAELSHRERQLASVGAKDLLDMRAKAPEQAPPSLLLVVDEFAALAAELPDFVDGMVNLAQRGRSLGIHLLLATQRPAGAINDNIRANTNLRISLRMNDRSDSEDVIGSPAAAALPRNLPGRAFVRTGSTELSEVQVAYSGGHSFGRPQEQERASITLEFPGKPKATIVRELGAPDAVPDDGASETDLQHVVRIVRDAFDLTGSEPARRPWLPPLAPVVGVGELPTGEGTRIALGLRDEPQHQSQAPHWLDISEGGFLVAGSGATGKSTTLRTAAATLARQLAPDELHLYGLDFGSRGLAPLAALPHTGDVVLAEETDRVIRLLTMLQTEIGHRRALMSEHGVTTVEQLRAAVGKLPRVVSILDGYPSFAQAFERIEYGVWVDRFPTIVTEGRAVDIHWMVSADRRLSLPPAVQAALPQRLVLRFADTDEYDGFGLERSRVAGAHLPPGRGFSATSDEVQVAVLGEDGSPADQAAAIEALAARLAERWPGSEAPGVRLLPTALPARGLQVPPQIDALSFGIRDATFDEVTVSLQLGGLLVVGARRSGKSTTLRTLTRALASMPDVDQVLLAPKPTPLQELDHWAETRSGADACADLVEELLLSLEERTPASPWLVVVLDDADELSEHYVDERIAELAKQGMLHRVRVVAAADKRATLRAYGGTLPRLRAERRGIVLQPDPDIDGDLFECVIDRRLKGGGPGRAILAENGTATLVQVATHEDVDAT